MTKRIFDFIFSLTGLAFLFPILFIAGIIIKLDSIGPIFFTQLRIGMNFRSFKLYKFRTMIANTKGSLFSVTTHNDQRITRVGKFLRKYKIDELPQFINVLKGEMSIVGPRPEVPEIVELYNEEQKRILSIKPGLTSTASIEYIEEEDMMPSDPRKAEEKYVKEVLPIKLNYNLLYLKNRSVWYDIVIICRTIKKLFY